jgi:signal transduction histidine kinase
MPSRHLPYYLCLSLWLSQTAYAEPNHSSLAFAYQTHAAPVSSYNGRTIQGFCSDLFQALEQQGYSFSKVRALDVAERFEKFAEGLKGQAGIQCGPDSKTRERSQHLVAKNGQYNGAFSDVFAVTSTKLLIRNTKLIELEQSPETLRIGLIKPQAITNSLIQQVYPNAQIIALNNRAEAIKRLTLESSNANAIDAYSSDEILLYSILTDDLHDAKQHKYSIEPKLYGYSREEYVITVYNNPNLLSVINQWLKSGEAKAAINTILPKPIHSAPDTPHLNFLLSALVILMVVLIWFIWQFFKLKRATPSHIPQTLQNHERSYLAQTLHDDILQLLVVSKRRIELGLKQLSNNNPKYPATFKAAMQLIDDTIDEIRRISHEIRLGKPDKIAQIIREFKESTNIAVNSHFSVSWAALPDQTVEAIKPILLEALRNIERHAQASLVTLSLHLIAEDTYEFCIEDNGKGFTLTPSQLAGIGLQNMQARALRIPASLNIESMPNIGTKICMQFKIQSA